MGRMKFGDRNYICTLTMEALKIAHYGLPQDRIKISDKPVRQVIGSEALLILIFEGSLSTIAVSIYKTYKLDMERLITEEGKHFR